MSSDSAADSLEEASWADLIGGPSESYGAVPLPPEILPLPLAAPLSLAQLAPIRLTHPTPIPLSRALEVELPEAEIALSEPMLAIEPGDEAETIELALDETVAEGVVSLTAHDVAAESLFALEAADVEVTETQPVPLADFPGASTLADARAHAQATLVEEMNEALRRSGALGGSESEAWLNSEPAPNASSPSDTPDDTIELSATEVDFESPDAAPSVWSTPRPNAERRPLRLNPAVVSPPMLMPVPLARSGRGSSPTAPFGAETKPEDDLWRIVQGAPTPHDDLSASFEEALRKVDSQLETLVGLPGTPEADMPVEAIVEESLGDMSFDVSGGWSAGDIGRAGEQTSRLGQGFEENWPFDEDDLATDPSDPAEAAKERRQRLLRRAMQNLGAIGHRPAAGAEPAPREVAGAVTVPDMPATSAQVSNAPRTPDETQLAALIERRFADIKAGVDRFAILGLPRDASREQVKGAFLDLAKIFHPDRLPASLQHLAQKMTGVFEGVRDAYEVLYDDIKRRGYLVSLAAAPALATGPRSKQADAEEAFRRGEALFRKREYVAAEEQYERAFAQDAKALYLAAQGWCLYMDPTRKAEAPRATKLMTDALKLDPSCDRAHYQLGVIARVEGDVDRAERAFREAVRSNPKHLEANQELRLIEMRKKNSKRGGFFR